MTPNQGTDTRQTVRWRPEWDWKKCKVVIWEGFQGLLRKSQSSELSGYCAGPVDFVQSYGMQYDSENPLFGITLGFFPRKSRPSQWRTVKDFTKTLWIRKSSTKASGPQVCLQTVAGQWRGMYLTPNTGESRAPLHFRGKFLPVSWAYEVLFCTFKFLCILKPCLIKKILFT